MGEGKINIALLETTHLEQKTCTGQIYSAQQPPLIRGRSARFRWRPISVSGLKVQDHDAYDRLVILLAREDSSGISLENQIRLGIERLLDLLPIAFQGREIDGTVQTRSASGWGAF